MSNRIVLGCHLSTTGGFAAMGQTALSLDATTFAFFTRNPRGGRAIQIPQDDAAELIALMDEHDFGKLVAHAPYTMNLCSAKPDTAAFGREMLADDLARMETLPGNYYNFHPGSHVGQGAEVGIQMIADALNEALVPGQSTTILLETMAGKGTEVGRSFEELRAIIDGVTHDELLGVCLDTCHVSDGGYDIAADLEAVLDEFDRVIGLDRLRALHLNDSKNPCGAHKDRHEKIGQGELGIDLFAAVVNHPVLCELPMILETPNELSGYQREIAQLRALAGEGEV